LYQHCSGRLAQLHLQPHPSLGSPSECLQQCRRTTQLLQLAKACRLRQQDCSTKPACSQLSDTLLLCMVLTMAWIRLLLLSAAPAAA